MDGEQLLRAALTIAGAAAIAWLASWLSALAVRRAARGRRQALLSKLHQSCHRPWTAFLFVVALFAALELTELDRVTGRYVRHGLLLALIGTTAWLAVKALFVAEDVAFRRFPIDIPNNRRMRRARTQIGLLRRLTAVVITVLALAVALMTFAPLRTVGASLLASAGVVGIIAGLAAQTTLGHVFAGMQLAFTDTLRLDDAVVVEKEWGRIEEMRLTHVVLRLWDERRLILPTTYFTTTPFQNWTRHEARVVGEVALHLDHTTPVGELRAEAWRVVEASKNWDGRDCVVQVVDSTPSTMVIRVLASAADGPRAWDLRCELREELIGFLRDRYPQCLPLVRAEVRGPLA